MTNTKTKLLIIDTDRHILSYLKATFSSLGYAVFLSTSGIEAARKACEINPDIILLDPDLPDIYTEDLIPLLRKDKAVPIIIISDKADEIDKVHAFGFGADDYLTKPFGVSELSARIKAALKHSAPVSSELFKNGELTVNFDKREVKRKNEVIRLTATEYALFAILAKSAGKVLTYPQLIRRLWGRNSAADTKRLHVNMANIRKKLSKSDSSSNYILTENGIGYIMPIIK